MSQETNTLRCIQIGNNSYILNNVTNIEVIEQRNTEDVIEKALYLNLTNGKNELAYSGDPKIVETLHEHINTATGKFLDLNFIITDSTTKESEPEETESEDGIKKLYSQSEAMEQLIKNAWANGLHVTIYSAGNDDRELEPDEEFDGLDVDWVTISK